MRHSSKIARLALILIVATAFAGCKKYEDKVGSHDDPRFKRLYCNVPTAVNYNWDFPGTPDSSGAVCFYPTDIFKGNFIYTDSIYNAVDEFVRDEVKTISIVANSRTSMNMNGFCGTTSLLFTANRNLRADVDSTTGINGQLLCRNVDTLSGYVFREFTDSTHIQFAFRVGSDTGVFFHRGTALKQ